MFPDPHAATSILHRLPGSEIQCQETNSPTQTHPRYWNSHRKYLIVINILHALVEQGDNKHDRMEISVELHCKKEINYNARN